MGLFNRDIREQLKQRVQEQLGLLPEQRAELDVRKRRGIYAKAVRRQDKERVQRARLKRKEEERRLALERPGRLAKLREERPERERLAELNIAMDKLVREHPIANTVDDPAMWLSNYIALRNTAEYEYCKRGLYTRYYAGFHYLD